MAWIHYMGYSAVCTKTLKGLGQLKISKIFEYFWFPHILWVYLTGKTCGQHQFTSLNILGHPSNHSDQFGGNATVMLMITGLPRRIWARQGPIFYPKFFDRLFLISAYWNSKTRHGPDLGCLSCHGGPVSYWNTNPMTYKFVWLINPNRSYEC